MWHSAQAWVQLTDAKKKDSRLEDIWECKVKSLVLEWKPKSYPFYGVWKSSAIAKLLSCLAFWRLSGLIFLIFLSVLHISGRRWSLLRGLGVKRASAEVNSMTVRFQALWSRLRFRFQQKEWIPHNNRLITKSSRRREGETVGYSWYHILCFSGTPYISLLAIGPMLFGELQLAKLA